MKKVLAELEKRQKQLEYDTKLAFQDLEVKVREEVLSVGNELDRKQEGHKDYFETKIEQTHKAIKNQLIQDSAQISTL